MADQSNNLEAHLNTAIGNVFRAFTEALVTYLGTLDKNASEVTLEEIVANVYFPAGSAPPKSGESSRRAPRVNGGGVKVTPSKGGSKIRRKAKDGPPPDDYCGYVMKFGDNIGEYCLNDPQDEVYELDEGPRRFCIKCQNGKQVVKDIIAGKVNTLIPAKKSGGARKSKGKVTPPETPDQRPGDFSSSVPGEEGSVLKGILPYGGEGTKLFQVTGTNYILYQDSPKSGHVLVAVDVDGEPSPPTDEAREWAEENFVEIVDKPELFGDEEETPPPKEPKEKKETPVKELKELKEVPKEDTKKAPPPKETAGTGGKKPATKVVNKAPPVAKKVEKKEESEDEEESDEEEESKDQSREEDEAPPVPPPKSKTVVSKAVTRPGAAKPKPTVKPGSGKTLLDIPGTKK